jgi:hypothetical protein
MAFNPKHTWYVAFYGPPQRPPGNRSVPRITETFQSESEAKDFARLKLAEGRTVNAGTVNPHMPKRIIAGAEIHIWLGTGDAK